MNFKPILFSTPMVKAIKEGRKTQTRRIIKPQPKLNENGSYYFRKNKDKSIYGPLENISDSFLGITNMGKYQPGDIMWVRETWQYSDDLEEPYLYKQKELEELKFEFFKRMKWKPSIFMPKKACRIFLEVTNVRVERLQEISEDDCISEGIENFVEDMEGLEAFRNYTVTDKELKNDHWAHVADHAEHSFETLWISINGEDSWDANPLVWVYDFKRVERPKNFLS